MPEAVHDDLWTYSARSDEVQYQALRFGTDVQVGFMVANGLHSSQECLAYFKGALPHSPLLRIFTTKEICIFFQFVFVQYWP